MCRGRFLFKWYDQWMISATDRNIDLPVDQLNRIRKVDVDSLLADEINKLSMLKSN